MHEKDFDDLSKHLHLFIDLLELIPQDMDVLVGIFGCGPCTHDVHTVPVATVTFRFDRAFNKVSGVKEQLIRLSGRLDMVLIERSTL